MESHMPKIMVVDDDLTMQMLLCEYLSSLHYNVVGAAETGQEAIEMAGRLKPDLILMDILMPGPIDGIKAAEEIKKTSNVAVVFLTGMGDPELVERAKRIEPFGYVMKPVEEEEVRAFVEIALHKRKMETALRQSEQRFRDLFESTNDLIYTQDLEGRFISINPSLEKTYGYQKEEIIGRSAADFMPPESRSLFESEYLENLKKQKYYSGMLTSCRKDGTRFYIEYESKLVLSETGEPYINGIGRDITQRIESQREKKRLEAQLQQTRKMEAIATLTGGIAHDYNNLLAIILGNLSMIETVTKPGDDMVQFLSRIETASLKAKDLTHELMALSRGGMPIKKTGALKTLLHNIANSITTGPHIRFHITISENLRPISYDAGQIGSLFKNVISNAVESMPEGGIITLAATNFPSHTENKPSGLPLRNGDYVKISIQDQGVGISEEDMSKIFDPYFSTKEMGVQKGMGLGLATASAIVRKHDGNMEINSQISVGTTVDIYLPAESLENKG